MEEGTKKCAKCGRELPASEFYKNSHTKDGLYSYCKDCSRKREQSRKKKTAETKSKLSDYTARQLIDELVARGYTGLLEIREKKRKEVELDGIKGVFEYTERHVIDITNF